MNNQYYILCVSQKKTSSCPDSSLPCYVMNAKEAKVEFGKECKEYTIYPTALVFLSVYNKLLHR